MAQSENINKIVRKYFKHKENPQGSDGKLEQDFSNISWEHTGKMSVQESTLERKNASETITESNQSNATERIQMTFDINRNFFVENVTQMTMVEIPIADKTTSGGNWMRSSEFIPHAGESYNKTFCFTKNTGNSLPLGNLPD